MSSYGTPTDPIGPGKARVLVAHTATVAPADVRVDGQTVFTNIANGEFATADVPAGTHEVELLPTGSTTQPILGPIDLTVAAGTVSMVYAVGNPRDGSMKVILHSGRLSCRRQRRPGHDPHRFGRAGSRPPGAGVPRDEVRGGVGTDRPVLAAGPARRDGRRSAGRAPADERPDTNAGSEVRPAAEPVRPAQQAASQVVPEAPRTVRLPGGTTVRVRAVGTRRDGRLAVPRDVRAAGWWRGGSRVGDPFGAVLVAGHVDSRTQGLGAYAELLTVRRGQEVVVGTAIAAADVPHPLPAPGAAGAAGGPVVAALAPRAPATGAGHLRAAVRRGRAVATSSSPW